MLMRETHAILRSRMRLSHGHEKKILLRKILEVAGIEPASDGKPIVPLQV